MTLNFMQEFPDGMSTNFVGKIVKAINETGEVSIFTINRFFNDCEFENIRNKYSSLISLKPSIAFLKRIENPKLHTIRRGNRWKEGTPIHFKIWTGKPYVDKTFNFAPVIPCKGVQEIEFKWRKTATGRCVNVFIDGKDVTTNIELIDNLAVNDGFDNRKDFFEWFKDDFKGQIIHWTNLKY